MREMGLQGLASKRFAARPTASTIVLSHPTCSVGTSKPNDRTSSG